MKSNQSTLEQVRKIYLTEFYDDIENSVGDIGLAQIGNLNTDQSGFKAI